VRREEYTVVGGIAALIAQQLRTSFLTGEDRHKEPVAVTIDSPTAKADDTATESSGVDTQNTPANLARSAWSRMQSLFRHWPGVVVAGSMAVLVAAAYLLAAPMGRDLSAQMAHAQLAESYWPGLLSLRWFGGVSPLG